MRLTYCVVVVVVILAFRIPTSLSADSLADIQWVNLPVEPAINDAIEKDKEDVRKANLADPDKKFVGLLTGADWLQLPTTNRAWYIRAIADFQSLLVDLYEVTYRNLDRETKAKGSVLDSSLVQPSYTVGPEMQSTLVRRLSPVTAGRAIRDQAEAVTKYYENNPLFRERPVLWVLTVPLFKELKAASASAKGSREERLWESDESITVGVRKPRKTQPAKGTGLQPIERFVLDPEPVRKTQPAKGTGLQQPRTKP